MTETISLAHPSSNTHAAIPLHAVSIPNHSSDSNANYDASELPVTQSTNSINDVNEIMEDNIASINENVVMAEPVDDLENIRLFVNSICRELNAVENLLVNQLLSADGESTEKIAEFQSDIVTRESIRKLNPGVWLNDEIINFQIFLLKKI